MKLLNCTQIAQELGRARHYITAMKAAGYKMRYGTRDVMSNVLAWLEANPHFRTTEYVARSRTGKGRRRKAT